VNTLNPLEISRRSLLVGSATSAVLAVAPSVEAQAPPTASVPIIQRISLEVNGQQHNVEVDTRTSLLDLMREKLGLTGTKKGCDHGQCGACTILVNGQRINSCLSLAVMHSGDRITTIEGIGTPDKLHPLQAAFVKHDGYQCGYCTSGQICSALGMLGEIKAGVPSHAATDIAAPPALTNSELRERMSGNICRCGAYSNIAEAIAEVAGAKA